MTAASAASAQLQPQSAYPPPPAAQPAYQPAPAPAPAPAPYGGYQQPAPAPAPQAYGTYQQPAAAPAPAPAPTPAAEPATVAAQPEPPPPPPAEGMNPHFGPPSDHTQVTGHLAIAYFGVTGVPIGHDAIGTDGDTVDAPAIGVRYWLNETLGIDAGLGFGFSSAGGTGYAPGQADQKAGGPGRFAFLLHGGVPISVYHAGHYNALFIPELNLGYATGINDTNPTTTADDVLLHGFLLGLGVRAGAEWHLDVLGVPQATLQLTVGVHLVDFESRNGEQQNAGVTISHFGIRTDAMDLSKLMASGIQVFMYL